MSTRLINGFTKLSCKMLLAMMICVVTTEGVAQTTPAGKSPQQIQAQTKSNYGKLPMTFEANQGQTDKQVKFMATGQGYSVFLTANGMALALRPSESVAPRVARNGGTAAGNALANALAISQTTPAKNTTDTALFFNLVGAAAHPVVVGEDLQPTKVNYFIGRDPKKWQTNVPTYGKVRYKDVYPGIDLVYYGNNRQVEYDFVVAPGADASKVQFEIKGADQLRVDASGDLVLKKGDGEMHFQAPNIFQMSGGQRVPVAGGYSTLDGTHIGFQLARHDQTAPLVIDPVLVYSTFLGGRSDDDGTAIAVDAVGNAYVSGTTRSPDFPLATMGGFNPLQTRIFVAKLDVSGASLLFADYFGGTSGNDYPIAMTLDSQGAIYITGYAYSSDFPVVNPFQASQGGYYDAFLSKFSADGSSLLYSTYLGGTSYEFPYGVAVNNAGEMFVAGLTESTDFPLVNPYQTLPPPDHYGRRGTYGFVTKFAADGASAVFSTYLGGSDESSQCGGYCYNYPYSNIAGLALDSSGNVYVAGSTDTNDFPVTEGAYLQNNPSNLNYYNSSTGFVSRFNGSGELDYSTYFGGNSNLSLNAIVVDSDGAPYVTGSAESDGTLPITSTSICDPEFFGSDCGNAFVTKFNPSLSALNYSTFLGPYNQTSGRAIALDTQNNAYILADSSSTQFALVNPIEPAVASDDVFIVEIDPFGSTQLFATFLGAEDWDGPAGFAVDAQGSIYVVGSTESTFFPTTQSSYQSSAGGHDDVFVTKIGQTTAPAVAIGPSLLQYSTLTVGVTSAPRTALLRNMGSGPLTLNTKTITGDFAETDDCGSSVGPAGSCTFTVTFTPTAPGSRFGTILLGDDASGSPHFINLVGDGSSPIVVLSPASLSFGSLPVGTPSDPQTITLSNTGNATLHISTIVASGDFSKTSDCPSSLAFGSSCHVQVTFTPSSGGAATGTVTFTDDAPDNPQTVALTGSGYVTTTTVAPSSIDFGTLTVGSTSSTQTVTITNTGSNTMTVSSISVDGDFGEQHSGCGNCSNVRTLTLKASNNGAPNSCSSIPPEGGTCTVSVTFTPTVSGTRTGTLTINDNAQGNPHSVSLTGIGQAGIAAISPSSLTFPQLTVGSTSSAQDVTLSNTGNGPLTVTGIQATGDFAQTNNCTTVETEGSCVIHVTFTPTSSGTRTGTINVTDSAANSPQIVTLSGSGIDFQMTDTGDDTSTVNPGGIATYNLEIGPVGGSFGSAVTLICAGAPAFSTCTVNPASVTPGDEPVPVTVTVHTTASTAQLMLPGSSEQPMFTWWTLSPGIGVFGILLFGDKKRRSRRQWTALLGLLLVATFLLVGCGGTTTKTVTIPAKGNGTPKGTYTMVVIGTAGSVQHFTVLTLTVN